MIRQLAICALVFSAPLAAQTPADSSGGQVASKAKVDPLDKIICKTEESLGSRLGKRKVCAPLRDWKEMQEQNRNAVEEYQQKGQALPQSG